MLQNYSTSPMLHACARKLKARLTTHDYLTGLRVGGDRICNNGETESSTKDFFDMCLEI